MEPGTYDFTIYQGATFARTITWTQSGSPVDLTNYSARLHARSRVDSDVVLLILTDSPGSGDVGSITLGGAAGTVVLALTATETAALSWDDAVYDLELEDDTGVVTRLLQGRVTVSPEVTR